jgi:hypothetical protein
MAIMKKSDQQLYVGRGPLDPRTTVKTYSDLLKTSTWTTKVNNTDAFVAYNGMIVAVWLNTADATKNGLYLLYDPKVNSTIKRADVTIEENWHKLAELSDLAAITDQLSAISEELTGVKTKLASLEADKIIVRRDNESNYNKKTVIADNEVCLVDVPAYGLKVKLGDGIHTFEDLPYVDDAVLANADTVVIKGYFYQNQFYAEATHSTLLEAATGHIYIDAASSKLYIYNGIKYEVYKTSLPTANARVAGAIKLYDETGLNTDGTMTQRAITSELDEKFEMVVDHDDEMLVFGRDLY